METHQREKEKPWFQVNCKKNNCHVTLEANQANRPRNTHSLGFATTSMRGQGHFAKTKHGQDKNGNEKDKRRQTERAPLKPFFAVCLITFPFGGGAAPSPRAPLPPLFCKTPALLRANLSSWPLQSYADDVPSWLSPKEHH